MVCPPPPITLISSLCKSAAGADVGQRMAVDAFDGEPCGRRTGGRSRDRADRDPLVDACRDLAVGLDDEHVAVVELGVEEGLAAEALDHHHLARDLAGLGRPQMLRADAERDRVADLEAAGPHRDRDLAAAGKLDRGARVVDAGDRGRQEVHLRASR